MIKKENDSIVYEKVIPAHGAEYVSFPESMRPEIGDYLRSQGISRLYSHQAEMFVRAGEGEKPGHHDSDSKWQNFELFAAGIAEDFRESADACDFYLSDESTCK